MPTTPNFGWEKPDVGGDDDAWGTILNDTLDDIDEDVFALEASQVKDAPNIGSSPTASYDLSASPFAEVTCDVAAYPGLTVTITGGAALSNSEGMEGTLVILFSGGSISTLGATARITIDGSYSSMVWQRRTATDPGSNGTGPLDTPTKYSGKIWVNIKAIKRSTGVSYLFASIHEDTL